MTAINISLHDLSKKIESHLLEEAAARAQQGDIPDVPPSTAPGNLVQSQYGVVLSPINMYAQDQQNREAHHMLPQNTAVRARIRSRKSASHGRPLKRSDSGTLRIESLCAGIGLAVLEVLMKKRSAQQFKHWLSPECFTALEQRRCSQEQHASYLAFTKTPHVARSRAQRLNDETYEACIILTDGVVTRAMAMRVQARYGGWYITALHFI